jgi:sugar/nucleoside kinase (ribokinase family)
MIGPSTIEVLCRQARFLALNAQANSTNQGYNTIGRYPRADYVCVDQEEMRLAYYDRFGPMDELMRRARTQLGAKAVSVTQGAQGALILADGEAPLHAPVFSKEVVDTVGAGDAYLALTAPCAAAGFPPDLIAFVGNATGAMAVRYPGNRESVEPVPLFKFVTTLLK